MSLATAKCITCLKEDATCFSGHVCRGEDQIIAGFCRECFDDDSHPSLNEPLDEPCIGHLGTWTPEMGEQPFGEIGYFEVESGCHE
ncbi:MAG: hypothetical protein HOG49_33525 [Candidatus Scalindua sp.]|jgi:hypothetical protein|nr:hypothetical protein [Candidatus Scalindua sp.]